MPKSLLPLPIFGFLLSAFFLISLPLQASPAWWSQRGILSVTNGVTNTPADYNAINQGQLKNLGTAAAAELDADIPTSLGGAGDTLHSLIAAWSTPSTNTADYNAVNLGELKTVAAPFYDRLIAINYTNAYPWNATGHPSPADYNLANIGQAKNLFSFDLSSDTNNDGIPDWWEHYYGITNAAALAARGDGLSNLQAWQQGLNPNDYFNGATPVMTIVSGNNQTGSPNGLLPAPLVVSLTDGSNNPLVNAPVSFSITGSLAGSLQSGSSGTPGATITVRSDGNGAARAYLKLPSGNNTSVTITATAGLIPHAASTVFSETSDDGSATNSYVNPFAPSGMVATMNPDGSVDASWVNNADANDTNSIDVTYRGTNGDWIVATNVPAGTTSCHILPQ